VAEPDLLTVRAGLLPHVKRIVPRLFDSAVRRDTVRLVHVVVRKFEDAEAASGMLHSAATRANRRQSLAILNGHKDTW
jgi:hypothetical protein